ncbi:radical SAM protein [candidate division KSB1 bacterium]|nr:MAG: radical SAM protein [candidate division KSB1 bacterium]
MQIISNELIISKLIKSLTARRVKNLLLTGSSFFLSALTGKTLLWGRPAILTIEPTNVCNLRCPLCITGSGQLRRVQGRMSLDTFRKIMDIMGDDIFFLLLYHQGEPYLNPDFLEMVRMAKQKNIYCTTSTNGHYFDDASIRATIESGLDSMIVSVDGVTQETYARYRVNGKLNKVLQGTKRFMEIKKEMKSKTPLIALQFLVMKHNEHEIPAVRRLAKELGVDRLLIKTIEVHSVQEAKEWLPQNEKYRRYYFDGQKLIVKNAEKKSCPRPWLSTLINWDGGLVPCCFDKNGDYEMGNILNVRNLDEIWFSEKFQKFRTQLNTNRKSIDICRNCNQGFGSFIPQFRLGKKKTSH